DALELLRHRYRKLRNPYLKMFCAGLFLLLRNHIRKINTVIIDREYSGHEGDIRGILLNYLRTIIPEFPKESIVFREIKHSAAHWKAHDTLKGTLKPDHIVSLGEFMEMLGK